MSFTALSWSGGKDSALTLLELREHGIEPQALITTLTDGFDRISMHGVRRQLLHAQAAAAGVPLVEVVIPQSCDNETYEARFADAFRCPPLDEVESVAFGDLFLQDIRAYREERLISSGRSALFPLWERDTAALARDFIEAGFQARLACVYAGHAASLGGGSPLWQRWR